MDCHRPYSDGLSAEIELDYAEEALGKLELDSASTAIDLAIEYIELLLERAETVTVRLAAEQGQEADCQQATLPWLEDSFEG